ncbi:hypothetical protein HGM15179_006463 [Zosterops borbonicus]|uniref:Uncharacterized protein n=1 Tax=Zosterops borbonicus TaxID=364589 RepID=A0A8K1GKL0_9PASS|nr:hypothetical protein HGM15179_006463 [Zosterops borbonicus]
MAAGAHAASGPQLAHPSGLPSASPEAVGTREQWQPVKRGPRRKGVAMVGQSALASGHLSTDPARGAKALGTRRSHSPFPSPPGWNNLGGCLLDTALLMSSKEALLGSKKQVALHNPALATCLQLHPGSLDYRCWSSLPAANNWPCFKSLAGNLAVGGREGSALPEEQRHHNPAPGTSPTFGLCCILLLHQESPTEKRRNQECRDMDSHLSTPEKDAFPSGFRLRRGKDPS